MQPRNSRQPIQSTRPARSLQRLRLWYGFIIVVGCIFVVRSFYLQVIRHDYYQKAAFRSQLKEYDVQAERGTIKARNGDDIVPLVLNETLYTVFADPKFIKDPKQTAEKVQSIVGGDTKEYQSLLELKNKRYVVLAKRINKDSKKKVDELKIKGLGTRDAVYRTYPDNQLAGQVLGFVNDDGEGKYGIEEALNKELGGSPGRLKAITDAQGVPLPANKDNIITEPQNGKDVVLTLDIGVQQQVEEILKSSVEETKAKSATVVILDPYSGAVKAMASYPSYNPAEYSKVTDASLFNNRAVSAPIEVGSIMKTLTTAAALNQGVVSPSTSYFDPSFFRVDDATIKNVEEDGGAGTKTVEDILKLSLNTGATWLLMQMGGGEINQKARSTWHDYMTNHYQLGKTTGIEQGFEEPGFIPSPSEGFGLNITYANTAFGQAMTATPLQMGAAFASAINGGTYYQPRLVDEFVTSDGKIEKKKPHIVKDDVVNDTVSTQLVDMLVATLYGNRFTYGAQLVPTNFTIGGKTGTAQISKPEGGYYEDRFNGTYVGFVGGDKPEYVIAVEVVEPKVVGYAGAKAAAPVFLKTANMLINSHGISPKQ